MKKKVICIICGIFIFVAIVAMIFFAVGGKDDMQQSQTISIEGTWKVAAYINNGEVSIIDFEYMVFANNIANDFRDGNELPFISSKYTFDSNTMILELIDVSKKYTVERYTDNYIRLYETKEVYLELIRYPNEDMSEISVDTGIICGTWKVEYRNTEEIYAGEYMVFEKDIVSDYRTGSEQPTSTSPFSWKEGNCLCVDNWGKEMIMYPISEEEIIFVEILPDTGYVWELHKDKSN